MRSARKQRRWWWSRREMSTSELGTAAEIAWPRFASVIVGKLIIGRLIACPLQVVDRSSLVVALDVLNPNSIQDGRRSTHQRQRTCSHQRCRSYARVPRAATSRCVSTHQNHTAAANVLLQTIAPSQPSTGKLGRYGHAVWSLICI